MDEDKDKYLEAARIIAECKPNKLPHVLAMLKKGGFDFSDDEIQLQKLKHRDRTEWNVEYRKSLGRAKWSNTDDPLLICFRKAYEAGQSMVGLSEASGIHRVSLYNILIGETKLSPYMSARLEKGLKALGWLDDTTIL